MGVISEDKSFNTTLVFNLVELAALYFIFLIAFMICLFLYNKKANNGAAANPRAILPLHSTRKNRYVNSSSSTSNRIDINVHLPENSNNSDNNHNLDFSESPNLSPNLHPIPSNNTLETETTNFASTQRNSTKTLRNDNLFNKNNALNTIDDYSFNSNSNLDLERSNTQNENIPLQDIRLPHSRS